MESTREPGGRQLVRRSVRKAAIGHGGRGVGPAPRRLSGGESEDSAWLGAHL